MESHKEYFKGRVSDLAIKRMIEYKILPDSNLYEWSETFTGAFITKYPKYYCLIKNIFDIKGVLPQWSDFKSIETANSILCSLRSTKKSLNDENCTNTIRQYGAKILSVLNEYPLKQEIPLRVWKLFSIKRDDSVHVSLTRNEVERLHLCPAKNATERLVKAQFLIECYTGARRSDVTRMNPSNVSNGVLTYVAQKTGKKISISSSKKIEKYLPYVSGKIGLPLYNETIRELCKRAGIDSIVFIKKAGKESEKQKWECISSHTARRSFATILYSEGDSKGRKIPRSTICQLMGHSSEYVTERYICCDEEVKGITI